MFSCFKHPSLRSVVRCPCHLVHFEQLCVPRPAKASRNRRVHIPGLLYNRDDHKDIGSWLYFRKTHLSQRPLELPRLFCGHDWVSEDRRFITSLIILRFIRDKTEQNTRFTAIIPEL